MVWLLGDFITQICIIWVIGKHCATRRCTFIYIECAILCFRSSINTDIHRVSICAIGFAIAYSERKGIVILAAGIIAGLIAERIKSTGRYYITVLYWLIVQIKRAFGRGGNNCHCGEFILINIDKGKIVF